MPLTIADAAWGFVLPAIIAGAVMLLLRRFLPQDLAARYPAPVAVTVGFLTGYGLLGLGAWKVSVHWDWLPYIAISAAVVGPVALADGVRLLERWLLYAFVAVMAAWFLVPEWDDLEPSRTVSMTVVMIYVAFLAASIQPLAARLPGAIVGTVLSLCMIVVAAMMVPAGSLKFAQIAGAAAGGFVGCTTASVFRSRRGDLAGIGLPFAVLAAGLMLIGRVNSYSTVPLLSYLLPPLAPLGLWCAAGVWTSSKPGRTGAILAAILVIVPLAIAIGLAVAADLSENEGYEYKSAGRQLHDGPTNARRILITPPRI